MLKTSRLLNRIAAALALAGAGFALNACIGASSLDQLSGAAPTGSAFARNLYVDYAYLARSFGQTGSGGVLDVDETFFGSGSTNDLAEAFATKALIAASGTEVQPEPASSAAATAMRERLLRATTDGKDRFPVDAARAQADYDCWMLNGSVDAQRAAAEQCRASLNSTLGRLEQDMRPPTFTAFTPPPAPAPTAASFTVYFERNSRTLSNEQLETLRQVIATARSGRQSRISVVGHTDAAGSADANQALSLRRANLVADALVDMGARRDAIQTSGAGAADPEVPTADGVKEAKNRRVVVTLLP
jgi:OmpA-OmpF porin, OOP family